MLAATALPLTHLAACGGGSDASEAEPFAASDVSAAPVELVQSTAAAAAPASARRLPMVVLHEGTVDAAGVRHFSLVAQRSTARFHSGVETQALSYNGAAPGVALRLRRGEATAIRVRNDLAEPTSAHWHGLMVPASMDGGPHQAIAPGAQWTAAFTVDNPASTGWFHPHLHGSTGRQVVSGLAGLLIVDDELSAASGLPSTWGVDDVALIVQDKRFTPDGQIDYRLSSGDRTAGYLGDTLLINGAIAPVWEAPRQWVRLRLLNACNARLLTLRLSNGASMLQVANEGGLLAAPVARASVTLASGERAEVLVDLSAAGARDVALLARTMSSGMGMGMSGVSRTAEVAALTLRPALARQPSAIEALPATLPAAAAVVARSPAAERTFSLGGGMMGRAFTINGRSFDMGRIDFAARAGATEVWTFTNASGMAHPVHVHGVRMSLLSRNGAAPAAQERGLRDTFNVEPMQAVKVAVQTAVAPSSVPLMIHCHILEHEDAGMMSQFITV